MEERKDLVVLVSQSESLWSEGKEGVHGTEGDENPSEFRSLIGIHQSVLSGKGMQGPGGLDMDNNADASMEDNKAAPAIPLYIAAACSVLFTLLYVIPFYCSAITRPSPTLSRDAPSVIRARIRAVTISCTFGSVAVLLLIMHEKRSITEALALLGWWPVGFVEIFKSLLLTALLFIGPLFERGIAMGDWRDWVKGQSMKETLSGWIGWRNFVAGPITEEVTFRSIIISLHLLSPASPTRIIFITPLYFGIAHVHHYYEFRLTHPDTPMTPAILRSLFQFTYTTIFGWFAAFVYLRTGSLLAVIAIHAFCNWMGLPRFWGRVETDEPLMSPVVRGKEDGEPQEFMWTADGAGRLGVAWSVAYYMLLVAGAVLFYWQLWPLTRSGSQLAVL
ncbi:hypothetical protein FQN54_008565 [Arachnomyces sp. PD_36]|nr:hypothetical protein FQN54_008565 [Arachnomyces sp. PD_36]